MWHWLPVITGCLVSCAVFDCLLLAVINRAGREGEREGGRNETKQTEWERSKRERESKNGEAFICEYMKLTKACHYVHLKPSGLNMGRTLDLFKTTDILSSSLRWIIIIILIICTWCYLYYKTKPLPQKNGCSFIFIFLSCCSKPI